MRLDRLLASRFRVGSRREVARLLRQGRVKLQHHDELRKHPPPHLLTASTRIANPELIAGVHVDGRAVASIPPPPLLLAYNKPVGVHCTMDDPLNRPDLSRVVVEETWRKRLHPVGRLDVDTSGLLLWSSDGVLTNALLNPVSGVEREYEALVDGSVDFNSLRVMLEKGVETKHGVHTAKLSLAEEEEGVGAIMSRAAAAVVVSKVRLTVTEGKHRQVRKMLANCGLPVLELERIRYGDVKLSALSIDRGETVSLEGLAWAEGLLAGAGGRQQPRH